MSQQQGLIGRKLHHPLGWCQQTASLKFSKKIKRGLLLHDYHYHLHWKDIRKGRSTMGSAHFFRNFWTHRALRTPEPPKMNAAQWIERGCNHLLPQYSKVVGVKHSPKDILIIITDQLSLKHSGHWRDWNRGNEIERSTLLPAGSLFQ